MKKLLSILGGLTILGLLTFISGVFSTTPLADAQAVSGGVNNNLIKLVGTVITPVNSSWTFSGGGAGTNYFTNSGSNTFLNTGTNLQAPTINATSTTATSTFVWGISTNLLSVTSTIASSTFSNGINLTSGCFAISGVCVGGGSGSGTVNAGVFGQNAFYGANGTTISGTSTLVIGTTTSDANNVGVGTTSPQAPLSVEGNLTSIQGLLLDNSPVRSTGSNNFFIFGNGTYSGVSNVVNNFNNNIGFLIQKTSTGSGDYLQVQTSGGSPLFYIKSAGQIGIGDASPGATLSLVGNAAIGYASGQTAPTNGLIISGNVGIGSTTASAALTVGSGTASSSISVAEYAYGASGNNATSTSATLSPRTSNNIDWPIGTSATTLTLCNFVPGDHMTVRVVNGKAAAGALTWAVCAGEQLYWQSTTTPTQTTMANAWDIWSFTANSNTGSTTPSSVIISGMQVPAF